MADDANRQLLEARRLVNMLLRVCRQTLVFFEGASAMDKNRIQRLLRDAIRESDQFLNQR
ncbi:MAG: hypothetical protein O3B24_01165 [Verrucomicrobia bacterium]|nr:hypothetical protein [Verrucomicrobiota bacterium]